MSFNVHKSIIEVDDTVVVYLSPKQIYRTKVEANGVFQTRFGALKLNDLIGKPYGIKVLCDKGFVHILDMTPELWTQTLPHRTQILYTTDISFILLQLEIKSGSVVVEAGTGSGSLSHSIARTVSPDGKLYTYDFHEERARLAQVEFNEHNFGDVVVAQHRDVCTDGFDCPANVDAVFLDLPHPWKALHHALKLLRSGGRICCFSPCMEQVQQTCNTLNQLGFIEVQTYECLSRPHEIKAISLKNYVYPLSVKENNGEQAATEETNVSEASYGTSKRTKFEKKEHEEDSSQDTPDGSKQDYVVSYIKNNSVGHTGFLTFATKFV